MKTWVITIAALSIFLMVQASATLGQQGPQRPLPFDPKTIETVQGMVVDAPRLQTGGIPEMEHLTLQTPQEKLLVVLAPTGFWSDKTGKSRPWTGLR